MIELIKTIIGITVLLGLGGALAFIIWLSIWGLNHKNRYDR